MGHGMETGRIPTSMGATTMANGCRIANTGRGCSITTTEQNITGIGKRIFDAVSEHITIATVISMKATGIGIYRTALEPTTTPTVTSTKVNG